jgi:tRNA pseudouridine13 synthase
MRPPLRARSPFPLRDSFLSASMTRWHADLPRLVGQLKSTPEDFVVEEISAYEPAGDGEHLFLWIEKRDLAGEQMLRALSRALGIRSDDIGCAGIKDRFAVTRQWLSIPARYEARLAETTFDRLKILKTARHANKLRTGHLRGNRFSILIRDAQVAEPTGANASPIEIAEQFAERMRQRGFPNYYGDQRFGREGETLKLGFDLLAGRTSPREIPYSRRKFLLRMSLSAAQSELFNRVLAARVQDGLADSVLAGDVMEVVASGGKFVVEDPAAEQPRCDAYETVITGPMFGPKMKQPSGVPEEREARVLAEASLTHDRFQTFRDLTAGTRRPLIVRPGDFSAKPDSEGLRFEFTLPAGAYATTLLKEIFFGTKPAPETQESLDQVADGKRLMYQEPSGR